jgi:hypothetical protein
MSILEGWQNCHQPWLAEFGLVAQRIEHRITDPGCRRFESSQGLSPRCRFESCQGYVIWRGHPIGDGRCLENRLGESRAGSTPVLSAYGSSLLGALKRDGGVRSPRGSHKPEITSSNLVPATLNDVWPLRLWVRFQAFHPWGAGSSPAEAADPVSPSRQGKRLLTAKAQVRVLPPERCVDMPA